MPDRAVEPEPDRTDTGRSAAALGLAFLELLPVDGVSISVFNQARKQSTIFASDATAARLDEAQFDLGEGPSFDSLRSTEPLSLPNLAASAALRWPVFANAISGLQARGLFLFPLVMGAASIGVASVYRTSTGSLSHDDLATGVAVARSIANPALRRAAQLAWQDTSSSGIPPIELRREVHQATGMIVAQLNTSATDAFSRLRAHAFSTNRTVHEVSGDVLSRRLDFSLLADDPR